MHDLTEQFALRRLEGEKQTAKGPEKVRHQVYEILDGPVRVAYVGTLPGQPINFLRRYPEEYQHAVKRFVTEQLGKEPTRVTQPMARPEPEQAEDFYEADDADAATELDDEE